MQCVAQNEQGNFFSKTLYTFFRSLISHFFSPLEIHSLVSTHTGYFKVKVVKAVEPLMFGRQSFYYCWSILNVAILKKSKWYKKANKKGNVVITCAATWYNEEEWRMEKYEKLANTSEYITVSYQ